MKFFICFAVLLTAVAAQNETTAAPVEDDVTQPPPAPTKPAEPVFKVTSVKMSPFLSEEGGKFVGYIPDLIEKLSSEMDIKLKIELADDGKYGQEQEDGSWSGMIGEVIDKKASMAAGAIFITDNRKAVVDFSESFMSSPIRVMTKMEEHGKKLDMFLAMRPFTGGVWVLVIICFLVFGVCMFLLNLFHPNEAHQKLLRGKGTQADTQTFNIFNSLWFGFSTLMWQGYEQKPRSHASRVLVAFWFFFAVFTLVLYTAAMVNQLSSARPEVKVAPFEDLTALLEDGGYQMAVIDGGFTDQYFKTAEDPLFDSLYNQKFAVKSVAEGIEKVQEGQFAFATDGVSINYYVNREPCNTVKIGGSLPNSERNYGIALPKDSELKDKLNEAILSLREDGTLHTLEKKWWVDTEQCPDVPVKVAGEVASEFLGMTAIDEYRFAGAIVIFIIGIILAFIVAVAEYGYRHMKNKPPKSKTTENLIEAEEGQALNETTTEKKEEKEEEAPKTSKEDVGEELEPEDKELKEIKEDKPEESESKA